SLPHRHPLSARMDAELHWAPTPPPASAWLDAPMVGAAVCVLKADALIDVQTAQRCGLDRDLLQHLAGSKGTHLATASDGSLWRIRALGTEPFGACLCLLQ